MYYDVRGNLTQLTDPVGHSNTYKVDAAGRITTRTDAAGDTTQFQYNSAEDLVAYTDPRGNTTQFSVDSAGRVTAVTDPLRNITSYSYDWNNRVNTVTNAKASVYKYWYDTFGNLTEIDTPNGYSYWWQFDSRHRPTWYDDPRQIVTYFDFDGDNNLYSVSNQRTPNKYDFFQFDGINRRIAAEYGSPCCDPPTTWQSKITYTYDAANRLTLAQDFNSAGTMTNSVTRTYDSLDRLTFEKGEYLGSAGLDETDVNYYYDTGGRRTRMNVGGPGDVDFYYQWDNVNRLTKIWGGGYGQTVNISYDPADRRQSVSYSNNIQIQYTYNPDSSVGTITYLNTSTGAQLGKINYQYDADGRRTSASGPYVRANLPGAQTWTYDAINYLPTAVSGLDLTYDNAGDVVCINACNEQYVFDERGEITETIDVPSNTQRYFKYDALGRWYSVETYPYAPTYYQYDGMNIANVYDPTSYSSKWWMLSGIGTDDEFGLDGFFYLPDVQKSVLAIADAGGNIKTQYTYGAFGETTESGSGIDNTFMFMGREEGGVGKLVEK